MLPRTTALTTSCRQDNVNMDGSDWDLLKPSEVSNKEFLLCGIVEFRDVFHVTENSTFLTHPHISIVMKTTQMQFQDSSRLRVWGPRGHEAGPSQNNTFPPWLSTAAHDPEKTFVGGQQQTLKGNNAAVVSIINVHDNLTGVWDFSLVLHIDSAGFSLCEGTVNGSRTDGV